MWILYVFSVWCLLCLCARLSICALWSPAGKGLTSLLSSVVFNCEFVTFPLVSCVRCGTWLYRFLIFAPFLILIYLNQSRFIIQSHAIHWWWLKSSKNDRVRPRNATITDCRPTRHGIVRKGHKLGIIQAVTVQYGFISSSFSIQEELNVLR